MMEVSRDARAGPVLLKSVTVRQNSYVPLEKALLWKVAVWAN